MKITITPAMRDIYDIVSAVGCISKKQIHCILTSLDPYQIDSQIIRFLVSKKILESMDWKNDQVFYRPGFQSQISKEALMSIWVMINKATHYDELKSVIKESFPISICFVTGYTQMQKIVPIVSLKREKLDIILAYLRTDYEKVKVLFHKDTPPITYIFAIPDESFLSLFETSEISFPYCISVVDELHTEDGTPVIRYYAES